MQKTLPPAGRHRRRFVFLMIAALVSLGGVTLWILSGKSVLPESSWTAIGAAFTVLGVAVATLQLLVPSLPSSQTPETQPSRLPAEDTASKPRGTLIIRAGRSLCGETVSLCSGFVTTPLHADVATNIVERKTGEHAEYIGEFISLPAGNYTAFVEGRDAIARVTISEDRPSEIDWRYHHRIPGSRNEKGRKNHDGTSVQES